MARPPPIYPVKPRLRDPSRSPRAAQKRLIITADDFGMHPAVNRAVARAHRHGVLTATSLMMGAPATVDAVEIATRLPGLRVGLHLMVAEGWASAPPDQVPAMADADGAMDADVIARSFRLLRPGVVRQLRRELRAQFAAFARTGLELDHVNVHKHLHMHPVVFKVLLDELPAHGRPPLRIPYEPSWVASINRDERLRLGPMILNQWAQVARRLARRAGVTCNDQVFGLTHSGDVNQAVLLRFVARLPMGTSEIYLHPADSAEPIHPSMRGYRPMEELRALLSDEVRRAIYLSGAALGGYR
jgi:hopanoid biosynthesis associated protein HpnK